MALQPDDIVRARERIVNVVRHTPLLESTLLNRRLGFRLLAKAECLQITGSFKWRGVSHVLRLLSAEQRSGGLLAFSSGNHAQAVACAAQQLGIAATIVMPKSAPRVKRDHTRAFGAEVIEYDIDSEDREQIARRIQADHPERVLIKPFDDPRVIAGQGTAIAEALEDATAQGITIDRLLIPCSGGGLLAGSCLAVAAYAPTTPITITACEPEGFAAVPAALQAGKPLAIDLLPDKSRLCDALLSPFIGQHCYAPIAQYVSDCASVNDAQVLQAMDLLREYLKLVVEPGGAAGLAAALQPGRITPGQTVMVLLSGGNA